MRTVKYFRSEDGQFYGIAPDLAEFTGYTSSSVWLRAKDLDVGDSLTLNGQKFFVDKIISLSDYRGTPVIDKTTGIEYQSMGEAAKAIGVCRANVVNCIASGWKIKGHEFEKL